MRRSLPLGMTGLLLAALAAAAAPAHGKKPTPREVSAPLDFSGVWELDPTISLNVASQMKNAVLSVTQKGNRIWIFPITSKGGSPIMGEEIVADGRPYEKALGPAGKGTVVANWAKDGQSLFIEVQAGTGGDPKQSAIQRSVWKLSGDRRVWIRESVSVSQGKPSAARLVFRRRTAVEPTPSPVPSRTTPHKKAAS